MGKESACNAGDPGNVGSILALGRFPGGGNGNPCLGNPMDRGAGQDTVHGVAKHQTQLSTHTQYMQSSLKRIWQIIKMVVVCTATVVVFLETWGRYSSITIPRIFCVDEYLHGGFFPLKGGAYFPPTECGMNSEICFQSCECGRNDHMWFLKLGHKVRVTWLLLS